MPRSSTLSKSVRTQRKKSSVATFSRDLELDFVDEGIISSLFESFGPSGIGFAVQSELRS